MRNRWWLARGLRRRGGIACCAHVLVGMGVTIGIETELCRILRVEIAVELHQQKQEGSEDEAVVRDAAEPREARAAAPNGQQEDHHTQRGNLTELDADVERDDASEHVPALVAEWDLLQTRG